jgi:hypothetical protein
MCLDEGRENGWGLHSSCLRIKKKKKKDLDFDGGLEGYAFLYTSYFAIIFFKHKGQ